MTLLLKLFRFLANLWRGVPPMAERRFEGAGGGATLGADNRPPAAQMGDGWAIDVSKLSMDRVFAHIVVGYMKAKEYKIDTNPDNGNIVYVSGYSLDYLPNSNDPDGWNDLRMIIKFDLLDNVDTAPQPYIAFVQKASTSPGALSSKSAGARLIGGVANVVPGQYESWRLGYHKKNMGHPALVQCAPVEIWRDSNIDNSDKNEMRFWGMFGINQHSTKPDFDGARVGAWSAGCLVGQDFKKHLEFLEELKKWDVFKKDNNTKFVTTVIDGKELPNSAATY